MSNKVVERIESLEEFIVIYFKEDKLQNEI